MDCKIYQNGYPAQPPKKRRPENNGEDIEERNFNSVTGLTDSMAYPQRTNNTETSLLREKLESEDGPIDFSVKIDKESLPDKRRKSLSPSRVVDIEYKSELNVSLPKEQERQEQSWKNFDKDMVRQEQLVANNNIGTQNIEFKNNNGEGNFERRRSLIHVPQPNKSIVANGNDHLHRSNGFSKSMIPELESYLKSSGNLSNPTANFNDILRSGSSVNGFVTLPSNDNFNSRPFQNYHPSFSFPGLYSPPVPTALTNGHQPFSFGTPELSSDRKLSKASRPFKIFENEILSYDPQFPYNSVSTYMHNRLIEASPQHSPISIPAANNPSPTHQEPSTSSNSNGSRIASNSPNAFSDDSQQSNSNQLMQQQQQQQQPDSCQSMRRRGQRIPEDKKDAAYLEKRRKNNEAAKRSRDARRRKEDQMALRAKHLMDRNKLLEFQVASIEKVNKILEMEVDRLKRTSCHQKCIIDSLQTELEKMRRGFLMNGSRNGERNKDGAPESPGL